MAQLNAEQSGINDHHLCPNPLCRRVFPSIDAICAHISEPEAACTQWAERFIDIMLYRVTTGEIDLDDLDDEQLFSITPLNDAADNDDLPPLPPVVLPKATDAAPLVSLAGFRKEYHQNRSAYVPGHGKNMLQQMDDDVYAKHRVKNVHYPFASRSEWQLANWLTSTSLPQTEINSFLHLDWVKERPPSFATSKDLRNRIEQLPAVPRWRHQDLKIPNYPTKDPMTLFYRDGLEVVKHLFSNPVFTNCMELDPYKLLETETGLCVFGEFMSAEYAWRYVNRLPKGNTMLGIILASDKTPLTIGTGNREMHPVLLSLANIHAGVRMKATSHAFMLVGYLPIPKFLNVPANLQAALTARIFHASISHIVANLKTAERNGQIMSDPRGHQRLCHTPLVSYFSDLPEQRMIACVLSNQSPISVATVAQFGDDFPHPRRTRDVTMGRIAQACTVADPVFLPEFLKACEPHGLNGVHQPFWADWGPADPSTFLTIDALHQWHKFFFDHPLKWVINIMGGEELDRRMAALQPRVGERHWPNGISKLKQCTGREHRDLQKILVSVVAGAVPSDVLCAMRALVKFIFQGQSLLIYDEQIHALREALREFHAYKNSIIIAGGRRGKRGPIPHFNIPKLELMQGAADSVRLMGAPYQYTSDITERCHITHVKIPYRMSNHRNFHEQCVRFMDRVEKARIFGLYTALKSNNASLLNEMVQEASEVANHYPEATWLSHVHPPDEVQAGSGLKVTSLFNKSRAHLSDNNTTAFLVTAQPHLPRLPVKDAANSLRIPDFSAALGDHFTLGLSYAARKGHWRSLVDCMLPFSHVHIWTHFRMQQYSSQDSRILLPSRMVQALLPSEKLPFGRCNTVIINDVNGDYTASSGFDRIKVMQVRLVFSPVAADPQPIFLYGEFFKFSSRYRETVNNIDFFTPAPNIDMFELHRHLRANGTRMADIVRLTDVRELVELVPVYGQRMADQFNCDTSLELADRFYLNNFASKDTFHAILSYQ